MKTTTKLIPALALLLISAVLTTTASFAWFTMNTEVTATGLDVNIVSDDTFLLISQTNSSASAIQTENAITVNFNESQDLKPVNHESSVASYATAANVSNWYTAKASAVSASTMKSGTKKAITGFNGYVLKKTLYFTIQKGYKATKNLTISAEITGASGKNVDSLTVLAVASGGSLVPSASGTAATLFSGALNDSSVVTVDIYIYYNGDNTTVYSSNKANLGSASIELTFNVDES